MPQNLGFSYQPGATRDIPAKGTATGGSGSTPQGPAKLLTYRIPKSPLGQSPIAPRSLLESPGGAGAGRGLDSLVAALMGSLKPPTSRPGVVLPPDNVVGKPTPVHPGLSTPTPVFRIPPQPGRPQPTPFPLPPLAPRPDGDAETPPLFDLPKPGPVNGPPTPPTVPGVPFPPQQEVPLRPSPGTPPHIGFTPDPPQGPPPPAEQQPAPPPEPEPVRSPIPDYKRDTLPETFDLAPLPTGGNDTQSLFSEPMDWHALKRLMAGGDY